jgi:hypothetical protein
MPITNTPSAKRPVREVPSPIVSPSTGGAPHTASGPAVTKLSDSEILARYRAKGAARVARHKKRKREAMLQEHRA